MTETAPNLLIVDDDTELAHMLVEFLELEGFNVATVASGEKALEYITDTTPDLVVLDVMLPGIDGFEVLKSLRNSHALPVIMLTARGEEAERIQGLTEGADDYLAKPFNPLELAARIRNVLRRSEPRQIELDILEVGALRMNMKRRELTIDSVPVKLTAAEQRVLEQLMRSPGEVISRANLTQRALNRPIEAYDRSVDTLVSKLRSKLADAGVAGEKIRSLRGHGYVLDVDSSEDTAQ